MKKIISLILCVLMLLSVCACGKDDGSLENYLENNGLPGEYIGETVLPDDGGDVSGEQPDDSTAGDDDIIDINDLIPEGGDPLPEGVVGSWSYVEIYQWAQASDITVDEAIKREKQWGVHFAYGSFSRYSEAIESPMYKVNTEATYSDMSGFGIDPSALKDIYGGEPQITSITVCTTEGTACTTVFLINGSSLIAFGEGMNVFMYEAVEAVG